MQERQSAYYTYEPRDLALPLLVHSVGLNQQQHPIQRDAGYGHFHFFRCIDGEGTVTAGGSSITLARNMGMILYPNEPHRYAPLQEPWLVDWITFDGSNAGPLLEYLEVNSSAAFELPYPEMTARILRDFAELLRAPKPTIKMDASGRLYDLLISLYWNTPASKNHSRELRYRRIEPVLRYMEAHYASPISLDQLAGQAGITPKRLCALFHEVLHMRPFWYLNTLRINNSKRMLLEDRRRTVAEVAALCGYDNTCYFNQTFKAMTGMTPTLFRQLH